MGKEGAKSVYTKTETAAAIAAEATARDAAIAVEAAARDAAIAVEAAARDAAIAVEAAARAAAIASSFPQKLKVSTIRWVLPGWLISRNNLQISMTDTEIFYIPIFVEETTTYIRIGIRVAVAGSAGGTADLRIFSSVNGLPGALILSAGTVAIDSTGGKEITISQTLTRGYYFLAYKGTVTCTLYGPDPAYAIHAPVAGKAGDIADTYWHDVIPVVAAVYADPAPTPTAYDVVTCAVVRLREN